MGIGAGAYSYIKGYRYGNIKNPVKYIEKISNGELPIDQGEKLSLNKKMVETIILWLRTKEGICYEKFYNRFSTDIHNIFYQQINKLTKLQLINKNVQGIQLSEKGLFLANKVFMEFIE